MCLCWELGIAAQNECCASVLSSCSQSQVATVENQALSCARRCELRLRLAGVGCSARSLPGRWGGVCVIAGQSCPQPPFTIITPTDREPGLDAPRLDTRLVLFHHPATHDARHEHDGSLSHDRTLLRPGTVRLTLAQPPAAVILHARACQPQTRLLRATLHHSRQPPSPGCASRIPKTSTLRTRASHIFLLQLARLGQWPDPTRCIATRFPRLHIAGSSRMLSDRLGLHYIDETPIFQASAPDYQMDGAIHMA